MQREDQVLDVVGIALAVQLPGNQREKGHREILRGAVDSLELVVELFACRGGIHARPLRHHRNQAIELRRLLADLDEVHGIETRTDSQ